MEFMIIGIVFWGIFFLVRRPSDTNINYGAGETFEQGSVTVKVQLSGNQGRSDY